jgi:SAM-dependent methyltransferase
MEVRWRSDSTGSPPVLQAPTNVLAHHSVMTTGTGLPNTHDWRTAGEAWGHAPTDWACLYEHYAYEVITAIFDRLRIGPGVELLDIACGAGLALRHAAAMGAATAGIDAAAALVEIARDRNPEADLRLGSMFELPWPAERFDAVTSINGIWGGCEPALVQAHRVLRPGGLIGISFWGSGAPHDLRGTFKAFARYAPEGHFRGMKRTNDIATPGVAEQMLTETGFEVVERGVRVSTIEWPDADIAWRALSSTGPAVPALQHSDPVVVRAAVLDAIEHCRDRNGGYRFRGDHQFVIARKPDGSEAT